MKNTIQEVSTQFIKGYICTRANTVLNKCSRVLITKTRKHKYSKNLSKTHLKLKIVVFYLANKPFICFILCSYPHLKLESKTFNH